MNASVLRILAYDGQPSLAALFVDKAHDRALYLGLGPFGPVHRTIAPLSLIASIHVIKHERIEDQPEYGVALRIHNGDSVKFGCRSRDQAMTIMRKLARFLSLHRTEEPAHSRTDGPRSDVG